MQAMLVEIASESRSNLPELDGFEMARLDEIATKLATLEERVSNNILFFRIVLAFAVTWLVAISGFLFTTTRALNQVAKAQADAPSRIVAGLLSGPTASKNDAAANLRAAARVLDSAKVGKTKPDSSVLKTVSTQITEAQNKYPDLPEVWQATGSFINYKSEAFSRLAHIPRGVTCETSLRPDLGWVFSGCDVSLEDLADRFKNVYTNGHPAQFTFIDSLVRYDGGPIPAKHMVFIGCAFEFHIPSLPPQDALLALRQLTTLDSFDHIEINVS